MGIEREMQELREGEKRGGGGYRNGGLGTEDIKGERVRNEGEI